MPTEYLFKPWKAPESVQQAARCLVGKDYPLPLVDHKEQRRVCVQRLKELAHSIGADIPGKYKINVSSTPVWSIAASIIQLSDIADIFLHLKIWNQVDFLGTQCFQCQLFKMTG